MSVSEAASIERIILLTGEAEAAALGPVLTQANPSCTLVHAATRDDLVGACETKMVGSRLIAFCSPVIVPKPVLDDMDCGSFNFHPGPPSYPGRYPSVFALYDGVTDFGITVHHMAPRVDEGPIVAVEMFPVPSNCDLQELDTLAFKALVDVFRRLAARLATDATPLPPRNISWSGQKRAKADCDALCAADSSLPADEIARRKVACGPHFQMKS